MPKMMSGSSEQRRPLRLAADIQTLDRTWRSIISTPAEPRLTMDVIEYGLGKQDAPKCM
jgi:hypothetical protein